MKGNLLIPLYRTARIRHLYLKNRMRQMGLAGSMHMILLRIQESPCCQDELGQRVLSDKAAVSRECACLEKMGLIETQADPADRRKRILCLTGAGERTAREISEVNGKISASLLKDISEEDREVFHRVMEMMEDNASELWEELSAK